MGRTHGGTVRGCPLCRLMMPDVDLKVLAEKSKNFSGAEIAGLVRSAVSFATEKCMKDGNSVSGVGMHFGCGRGCEVRCGW